MSHADRSSPECAVEGCRVKSSKRGRWCKRHARIARMVGDPEGSPRSFLEARGYRFDKPDAKKKPVARVQKKRARVVKKNKPKPPRKRKPSTTRAKARKPIKTPKTPPVKPPPPVCIVGACTRLQHARGWCTRHYEQWRRTGSPLASRTWHAHGLSGTPTYASWVGMIVRCTQPSHVSYQHYGGRGITVCDRWQEPEGRGLLNFLADMGPRPEGKSIDRIDVNGNYEPSNCRWATRSEQARNKRPKLQLRPPVRKA